MEKVREGLLEKPRVVADCRRWLFCALILEVLS